MSSIWNSSTRPLMIQYGWEVEAVRNVLENLFQFMELVYEKGDCKFETYQTSLFFGLLDDFDLEWIKLEDAMLRNQGVSYDQGPWELCQLKALQDKVAQISTLVEDLRWEGIVQEILTPLWENLWEIYEQLHPGPNTTSSKAR